MGVVQPLFFKTRASDNVELDHVIRDHEITREFRSPFIQISTIVPNCLEGYSSTPEDAIDKGRKLVIINFQRHLIFHFFKDNELA